MSKASELLSKITEGKFSLKLDPFSGEDRSKILQACEDAKLKVIAERDKNGYVVIEVSPDSAAAASMKQHATKDLKAKFKEVSDD